MKKPRTSDEAMERLRVVENERDEALKALNETRLERDKAMRERDHAVLASAQYERQDAMDQRSENTRAKHERNERRPWLRSYLSPCDGSLDEVLWEIAIGC